MQLHKSMAGAIAKKHNHHWLNRRHSRDWRQSLSQLGGDNTPSTWLVKYTGKFAIFQLITQLLSFSAGNQGAWLTGANHNTNIASPVAMGKDTTNIWVLKPQHCTMLMGCDCRKIWQVVGNWSIVWLHRSCSQLRRPTHGNSWFTLINWIRSAMLGW